MGGPKVWNPFEKNQFLHLKFKTQSAKTLSCLANGSFHSRVIEQ
jgi:hypothetical protein